MPIRETGIGALDTRYWLIATDQTGLTGDKSGSFDITTSGQFTINDATYGTFQTSSIIDGGPNLVGMRNVSGNQILRLITGNNSKGGGGVIDFDVVITDTLYGNSFTAYGTFGGTTIDGSYAENINGSVRWGLYSNGVTNSLFFNPWYGSLSVGTGAYPSGTYNIETNTLYSTSWTNGSLTLSGTTLTGLSCLSVFGNVSAYSFAYDNGGGPSYTLANFNGSGWDVGYVVSINSGGNAFNCAGINLASGSLSDGSSLPIITNGGTGWTAKVDHITAFGTPPNVDVMTAAGSEPYYTLRCGLIESDDGVGTDLASYDGSGWSGSFTNSGSNAYVNADILKSGTFSAISYSAGSDWFEVAIDKPFVFSAIGRLRSNSLGDTTGTYDVALFDTGTGTGWWLQNIEGIYNGTFGNSELASFTPGTGWNIGATGSVNTGTFGTTGAVSSPYTPLTINVGSVGGIVTIYDDTSDILSGVFPHIGSSNGGLLLDNYIAAYGDGAAVVALDTTGQETDMLIETSDGSGRFINFQGGNFYFQSSTDVHPAYTGNIFASTGTFTGEVITTDGNDKLHIGVDAFNQGYLWWENTDVGALIFTQGASIYSNVWMTFTPSSTLIDFAGNIIRTTNNVEVDSDSNRLKLGDGQDMSVGYDGTDGLINTSLVAASDLNITCGANKTIELQNTVWDELPPITIVNAKLGSSQPTLATFKNGVEQFTFDNTNDYIIGSTEVVHWYKEGTNIHPHLHWSNNGSAASAQTVKWELEYTLQNMSESVSAASAFGTTVTSTAETTIASGTADRSHLFTEFPEITGTGIKVGNVIVFRFSRKASTGTEPANDPFALSLGFHAEGDTMGSRKELTKT